MDLGIQGKRVLVTGGGRGLGRSIAECLAKEGAHVAVVSRSSDDLTTFVQENGNQHLGLCFDLMESASPKKMLSELTDRFGYPDIIVHNVGGTLGINDPLCDISEWQKVYRFNLEIGIEINSHLVPHLQKQKWGRIVHISSIASLENQGPVPYCSIKAALTAYARSLGRFLSADGISVSAVLPGAVLTKGGYWDTASQERPEHVERYLQDRMAIKRFGSPEEIGNLVAFLCSNHASFISGSAFLADGGQGRLFQ